MNELTAEQAEILYTNTKELAEDWAWERNENNRDRMKGDAQVIDQETGTRLTLKASSWRKGHSFALLWNNIPIRRFDFTDHPDPDTGDPMGPHKHRPQTLDWDLPLVYPVDDVTTSDPHEALIDFMEESRIEYGHRTVAGVPGADQYA
jgi:hypothetical protein